MVARAVLKKSVSTGATSVVGAVVNTTVITPDGTTSSPTQGAQAITDANGSVIIDYVPLTSGTYQLMFSYAGNSSVIGASSTASFSAIAPATVKATTSLSLTPVSASVKTGSSVHVDGALTGSSGISGATVALQIVQPDGSIVYPTQGASTVTDGNGKFSIDYTPTVVGTYSLRASFAGSEQYAPSSSSLGFSATAPAPVVSSTTYDYLVSSSVVKNTAGATVYTGSSFTTALNWAASQANKVVYIPSGTYTMTAEARLGSGSTLYGDGPTSTVLTGSGSAGILIHTVSGTSVKSIGFTGTAHIRTVVAAGASVGNLLFQDVTMSGTSASAAGCFYFWLNAGATLDGLTFVRCKAIDNPGCIGFLLEGDSSPIPTFKNVWFEDCIASGCGRYTHYNDWVVGFDFNEHAMVQDLTVLRCTAEYSFEAGFHFETGYQPTGNILFKDCVSNYNGQKPADHVNYENGVQKNPNGPWYSAGYFLGRSVWNLKADLVGCTATGNIPGYYGSWDPVTGIKAGLS